jgi:antitoxin component of MazEF toxin-antitoxin module
MARTKEGTMLGTLRKNGNSIVLTIPREELERVGAHEGDFVDYDIRPVDIRPRLTPRVETVARAIIARPETAVAVARLADA